MRNIRLLIEYDGTDFHGWQRQSDLRTVQGVVEEAVLRIFGHSTDVIGAGRTDRGVHALGYVCNFRVETDMTAARITGALQFHLPDDVVVKEVRDAAPEFHARFDAVSRCYAYTIATEATAIHRRFRYRTRFALDVEAMDRAARLLLGEHDFTSFTPAMNDASPVCRLSCASVEAGQGFVRVTVEANRFLHNMVRIIAGTLIDVGRGKISPEQIPDIVCRKDRTAAGPTAPPEGLALVAVRYPPGG